jgi:hypothetical protein
MPLKKNLKTVDRRPDADDAATSTSLSAQYTISVSGRVEIENVSLITSQIGMFRREIPFSRREIKQQQQKENRNIFSF